MLDLLKQISSLPCVNGSEFLLAKFIKDYFVQKGFWGYIDPLGNVIVKKTSDSIPSHVIFTAMDSPGFTCLYREDTLCYLTPTAASIKELKDIDTVLDYKGNRCSLLESKYDKNAFCIENSEVKLGSAFSIQNKIEIESDVITGRFAGRFACLAVLIKFAEQFSGNDIAFCFTSGFNTGYKSESTVLNRLQARNAVLLGFAESENSDPILCIKDGKHFSSKKLLNSVIQFSNNNKIDFNPMVSDKAISASERLFSPFTPNVLSMAIPCKNPLKTDESVVFDSMKKTFEILSYFNIN